MDGGMQCSTLCSDDAAKARVALIHSAPCFLQQVGKGRLYTPTEDDVGSVLKCEVVAIDTGSPYVESGKTHSIATSRVRPAPSPPRRSLSAINPAPKNIVSAGKFTALTYNLLADLYATVRLFGLCFSLLIYEAFFMCVQSILCVCNERQLLHLLVR